MKVSAKSEAMYTSVSARSDESFTITVPPPPASPSNLIVPESVVGTPSLLKKQDNASIYYLSPNGTALEINGNSVGIIAESGVKSIAGNFLLTHQGDVYELPSQTFILDNIISIATYQDQFYAVNNDGNVWYGSNTSSLVLDPNDPSGLLSNVKTVKVTYGQTMAIKNNGTLWSWDDKNVFDNFDAPSSFGGVARGYGHDCINSPHYDQNFYNWSYSLPRQVIGDLFSNNSPFLNGVLSVDLIGSAEGRKSIAVLKDGSVWQWGYLTASASNGDSSTNELDPGFYDGTDVGYPSDNLSLGVTAYNASCIEAWSVLDWTDKKYHSIRDGFDNVTGELPLYGDFNSGDIFYPEVLNNEYVVYHYPDVPEMVYSSAPVTFDGLIELPNFFSASITKYHHVALAKDGSLWGWGNNLFGQIAPVLNSQAQTYFGEQAYPQTDIVIPMPVGTRVASMAQYYPPEKWVAAVASSNSYSNALTYAINENGELWRWGNDFSGNNVIEPISTQIVQGYDDLKVGLGAVYGNGPEPCDVSQNMYCGSINTAENLLSLGNAFVVNWGHPNLAEVDHFELFESNSADFSNEQLIYQGKEIRALIIGKISGEWFYRVRACNGNGCSDFEQGMNKPVAVQLWSLAKSIQADMKPVIDSVNNEVPVSGFGLSAQPSSLEEPWVSAEWQISSTEAFDNNSIVFNYALVNQESQLALSIPNSLLKTAYTYWVRVRDKNSSGVWSGWSESVSFNTDQVNPLDIDNDGIDDRIQVNTSTDVNGNGILDQQEGIVAVTDELQEHVVCIAVSSGELASITYYPINDIPVSVRPEDSFNYGMFDFRIDNIPLASSIDVHFIFPEKISSDAKWYKYNPIDQSMIDFTSVVKIIDNEVIVTLTDGGDGDLDYAVNGSIVDPSGLVMLVAAEDSDSDGVLDDLDNCLLVPNVDQRDSDGDGYGNWCDADLNNDNIVNAADMYAIRPLYYTNNADADFNGDGIVNAMDVGLLRRMYGKSPGPSALVQ